MKIKLIASIGRDPKIQRPFNAGSNILFFMFRTGLSMSISTELSCSITNKMSSLSSFSQAGNSKRSKKSFRSQSFNDPEINLSKLLLNVSITNIPEYYASGGHFNESENNI